MTTFVSWLVLFHFAATLAVTVAEKNTEFVKGKKYRRLDSLQTAPYQKRESILSQETIEVVRSEASVHPRSLRTFYIPLFPAGRFPPSVSPLTLPSRSPRPSSLGEGRPLLKDRATWCGGRGSIMRLYTPDQLIRHLGTEMERNAVPSCRAHELHA
uniref:(California timema) hypothetical protein n=1 Tax=Timema californicum TaxID=61474 RepID=A0A7R9IVX8_TIMCA|nr:unnamed protein product [Timema californicum]